MASSPRPPLGGKAEPARSSPRGAAAAASPVDSPSKRPGAPTSVDKLLRRCLKMGISEAPKVGGAVFEVAPAALGGARELSEAVAERALVARLKGCGEGEDAVGVLCGCYLRLRDEARNARSRGDEAGAAAAAAVGETCAALGGKAVGEPGSLGAKSSKSREAVAECLLGKVGALRPDFVGVLLKGAPPETLAAVGALVVDGALALVRKAGATEADAAAACGGLTGFLQSAGKKVAGDALAGHAMFAAPPLDAPEPEAANPFAGLAGGQGGLGGLLQAMAAAAAANGGAALEQGTALGLVMRIGGADPADASARGDVAGLLRSRSRAIEGTVASLGHRSRVARDAAAALVDALVKNGPASREAVTSWFAALLSRSKDATATMLDARKVPSVAARLNACGCLLRLCRPVIGKADREANVLKDVTFLSKSKLGRAAYPADLTRVYASGEAPQQAQGEAMDTAESDEDMYDDDEDDDDDLKAALAMSVEVEDHDFHFVTQVFFLAFRALNLGLVAELKRHEDMADRLGHMVHRHGADHPQIIEQQAAHVIAEAAILEETLIDDAIAFCGLACRWLLNLSDDDLKKCPEHFLEDVADLPSVLAKFRPQVVRRAPPLDDLLKLVARCLAGQEKGD